MRTILVRWGSVNKKKKKKKHPHSETLCDWTKSLFQTKTEHADWL